MNGWTRRDLLRWAIAAGTASATGIEKLFAAPAASAPGDLDFQTLIQPVPATARFDQEGFCVWCGTMARTDDGVYHLLYSRWPRKLTHYSWVTHSEIAHATGKSPLGPFTFQGVALAGSGGDNWDAHVTHNPTVVRVKDKFYLYYTGNHGPKSWKPDVMAPRSGPQWWEHRNNQRIGVAVSDTPAGPWKRFDKPVLDVSKDSWDQLIMANPSMTPTPDGRFLLVYKSVTAGKMPFGGKVMHGAAFADDPLGPFKKCPDPIFTHATAKFPAEDPFVWMQDGRLLAIVKDSGGFFTNTGPGASLALFESADGVSWKLAAHPLVSTLQIKWVDGTLQKLSALERPQLFFKDGRPAVLLCAAADAKLGRDPAFNVQIPLRPVGELA